MIAAVKSLPVKAAPLPHFDLDADGGIAPGAKVLLECLTRLTDALPLVDGAINALETFTEDDEARQEALRLIVEARRTLKGGKQ